MIAIKTGTNRMVFILATLLLMGLIACSGGSGGGSAPAPAPAPKLEVLPSGYDFGIVTGDNTVAPLEVTIRNDGKANLILSSITKTGTGESYFDLNTNPSKNPCGAGAMTLGPGTSCNVIVTFDTTGPALFSAEADVVIKSNDPTWPTYNMGLRGSKEEITQIDVTINQINACPRNSGGGEITAYVSVLDQGGAPVTGLEKSNFALMEDAVAISASQIESAKFVGDNSATISVAVLLDYSYSLTKEPENVKDMQNATKSFVEQLRLGDEASIIKFATTTVDASNGFIPAENKNLLTDAIMSTPDFGGGETRLYDTLVEAIEAISAPERTTDRRAIIIMTDGEDNDGSGDPLSTNKLEDVINDAIAQGIPVFTIGLGDRVNPADLRLLAASTGGTYSDSVTSDNLLTIYNQLAKLLFTDQYILTYLSTLAGDFNAQLTVTVTTADNLKDDDTREIPNCY
jgi:Mg-chelatase subunit ChlD